MTPEIFVFVNLNSHFFLLGELYDGHISIVDLYKVSITKTEKFKFWIN